MKLRRGQILHLPVLLYDLTIFIDFKVTFLQPPHSLNVNVNVSLNTSVHSAQVNASLQVSMSSLTHDL